MSCRECDNFYHEDYCCTVQCGLYNPEVKLPKTHAPAVPATPDVEPDTKNDDRNERDSDGYDRGRSNETNIWGWGWMGPVGFISMTFAYAALAHRGTFSGHEILAAVLYVLLQLVWQWVFTFHTKL